MEDMYSNFHQVEVLSCRPVRYMMECAQKDMLVVNGKIIIPDMLVRIVKCDIPLLRMSLLVYGYFFCARYCG